MFIDFVVCWVLFCGVESKIVSFCFLEVYVLLREMSEFVGENIVLG